MCEQHRDEASELQRPSSMPADKKSVSFVANVLKNAMIAMVHFYQRGISPLLGKNCRYEPTCSQYFILAVEKYGPWRGAWKGFWRIMRCHPFRPGGYDPP
jgi:putative membrane protein insertion efficiency factor